MLNGTILYVLRNGESFEAENIYGCSKLIGHCRLSQPSDRGFRTRLHPILETSLQDVVNIIKVHGRGIQHYQYLFRKRLDLPGFKHVTHLLSHS